MFDNFKSWFFKPVQHIQVRYNTKVENTNLYWRVIVNGKESLASHIEIHGYVYGESSMVDGDIKMNIACDGKIYWHGTRAEIIAGKGPDLLS